MKQTGETFKLKPAQGRLTREPRRQPRGSWGLGLLLVWLLLTPLPVTAALTLDYFRATPDPVGVEVLLEWKTTAEPETFYEFHLQRAVGSPTNFYNINEEMAGPGSGTTFAYRDGSVELGMVYYYKLLVVQSSSGSTTVYGPISVTLTLAATATPPPSPQVPATSTPTPTPTSSAENTPAPASPTPTETVRGQQEISPPATPTLPPATPTPSPTETPPPVTEQPTGELRTPEPTSPEPSPSPTEVKLTPETEESPLPPPTEPPGLPAEATPLAAPTVSAASPAAWPTHPTVSGDPPPPLPIWPWILISSGGTGLGLLLVGYLWYYGRTRLHPAAGASSSEDALKTEPDTSAPAELR